MYTSARNAEKGVEYNTDDMQEHNEFKQCKSCFNKETPNDDTIELEKEIDLEAMDTIKRLYDNTIKDLVDR